MILRCCETAKIFTGADEYEEIGGVCVPTLNDEGYITGCDAAFEPNHYDYEDYPAIAAHIKPIRFCPWCGTDISEIIILKPTGKGGGDECK